MTCKQVQLLEKGEGQTYESYMSKIKNFSKYSSTPTEFVANIKEEMEYEPDIPGVIDGYGFEIVLSIPNVSVFPSLYESQAHRAMSKHDMMVYAVLIKKTFGDSDLYALKEQRNYNIDYFIKELTKNPPQEEVERLKQCIVKEKEELKKIESVIKSELYSKKDSKIKDDIGTTYKEIAKEINSLFGMQNGDIFRNIKKSLSSLQEKGIVSNFHLAPVSGSHININKGFLSYAKAFGEKTVSNHDLVELLSLPESSYGLYTTLKGISYKKGKNILLTYNDLTTFVSDKLKLDKPFSEKTLKRNLQALKDKNLIKTFKASKVHGLVQVEF